MKKKLLDYAVILLLLAAAALAVWDFLDPRPPAYPIVEPDYRNQGKF